MIFSCPTCNTDLKVTNQKLSSGAIVKCPNCEDELKLNLEDDKKTNKKSHKTRRLSNAQILSVILLGCVIFICSICGFLGFLTDNEDEPSKSSTDKSHVVKNKDESEDDVKGATERKSYEVTEVVDGDTIKIKYEGEEVSVRLIGIDTPELSKSASKTECFAHEAEIRLKQLLEDEEIYIEFDETQGEKDKYGRLLLYVWRESDELFINRYMISEGYAHEYTYNLPYKYQKEFQNNEKQAKADLMGLWGDECACEMAKEKSRNCVECNFAKVVYTNWDCSTYSKRVKDNSCTAACVVSGSTSPIPAPSPSPKPPANPSPAPSKSCKYSCVSPDRNCSDFSTQAEAQAFFNCCGFTATNDPMRLDGSGVDNGIACESLP